MGIGTLFGLSLSVIILRLTGLVPHTGLVLALTVFIWLWGYVVARISDPTGKKLVSWVFGIFLAATLLGSVGWGLYENYIQPSSRLTRAALGDRKVEADLEAALRLNPKMLDSRIAVADHLGWLQSRLADRHAVKLQDIQSRMDAGKISPQAAWSETLQVIQEEKDFRQRAREAAFGLSAVGSWSLGSKAGIVGAALFVLVLLIPALPGRKLATFVASLLLLAALALWLFPEFQPAISGKLSGGGSGGGGVQKLSTGFIIEAGERLEIVRLRLDKPTPKIWVKAPNGEEGHFPPWPQDKAGWFVRNNEPGKKFEVFLELPSGLNLADFSFNFNKRKG